MHWHQAYVLMNWAILVISHRKKEKARKSLIKARDEFNDLRVPVYLGEVEIRPQTIQPFVE
jgi:hypothetical protein